MVACPLGPRARDGARRQHRRRPEERAQVCRRQEVLELHSKWKRPCVLLYTRDDLDEQGSKTVYDAISGGRDKLELGDREVDARRYVSSFGFRSREQSKKVASLSGGERDRAHLAALSAMLPYKRKRKHQHKYNYKQAVG